MPTVEIIAKPYETTAALRIGVVTAQWNDEVTSRLKASGVKALEEAAVGEVISVEVAGAVEIPVIAQRLLDQGVDAVICYASVIRGETGHYDFVCKQVSDGCQRLALDYGRPVIFGVLTTDTMAQALARAGGSHADVGKSCAHTCLDMLSLLDQLELD